MVTGVDAEALIPFGISAQTGRPLKALADESVHAMLENERQPNPERDALVKRANAAGTSFAVEGGIDANDLSQAGWGIIYSPNIDTRIKDALKPLIEHRRAEAGSVVIFEGESGYLKGDTAFSWLSRRRVRMDVVNPDLGVPFYLMIVAPPDEIPFEFQYALDIYWAVGRLWFDNFDEFRRYAESVVDYEKADVVPTVRRAVIFAPEHDFDTATQLFARQVVQPLTEEAPTRKTVWKRQRFSLQTFLADEANKDALVDILRSKAQGVPALIFSGSHGMDFEANDSRQRDQQGAIVCQDWSGYGKITQQHWFAASDVPADANLHGVIYFFYACHGGGCSELDNYDRLNGQPRRIADKPFLSRLPQTMLSHPNGGALAVLAHIERAWAYSFQSDRGSSQIQGFRDVLGRLLLGERIGQATDMFNVRWAALSTDLAEIQADVQRGAEVPKVLGTLWVARDDARNFMILGDPAVRLRVKDMPPL